LADDEQPEAKVIGREPARLQRLATDHRASGIGGSQMKNPLRARSNPGVKSCPGFLRCLTMIMASVLTYAVTASAGELVVYNLSNKPIACSVDGYTKASGADADLLFRIMPGQRLNIPPSPQSKDHASTLSTAAGCGRAR